MRGKGRIFRRRLRAQDGTIFEAPVLTIAYYGPGPNGRRVEIRETTNTADEDEAQTILTKRLRAVENADDGIAGFVAPNSATMEGILKDLLAEWERREIKSLRQSRDHLNAVSEYFGKRRASTVKAPDVARFAEKQRAGGCANATINRRTEILLQAIRFAVENGKLATVPKVRKLREAPPRQGFFTAKEIEAVIGALPEVNGEAVRFGYLTGWRRGEILGLAWESIDRTAGEIRLRDSKSGDARVVPMDSRLRALIDRRWADRSYETPVGSTGLSRFVFHRNGRALDDRPFEKAWRLATDACKLGGRLFHDLRRTCARDLLRAGVPQAVAMQITGHRTPSMYRRYAIVEPSDLLAALERRSALAENAPAEPSVSPIRPANTDRTRTGNSN